ncbi:hypothetical protein QQ045_013622 [Rhodiola kirilowii]
MRHGGETEGRRRRGGQAPEKKKSEFEMNHLQNFDLNVDCSIEEDEGEDTIHLRHNTCDSDDEFDIDLENDNPSPNQEIDGDFYFDNDDGEDDQMLNVVLDEKEIIPPYIGMVFGSADEVLRHCHEYGQANEFQIRIRSSERIKGTSTTNEVFIERNSHIEDFSNCTRLRLVCSKEGKFKSKSNNPQRATNTTVTGCQFKVNASACPDGLWKLTRVLLEHNHPCNPANSKFMKNYKYISAKNKKTVLENDMAVKYGGHDNVPFDERDCRNLISKNRRLRLQQGDFEAMRRHFCEMISSNSNFFYMYDTDKNGTLKNVIWADGRSRAAYKDFGDVVSFDTTYVSNRYKMPFAPFIGVNNHGQSILFGQWLQLHIQKKAFGISTNKVEQLNALIFKAPVKECNVEQIRQVRDVTIVVIPEDAHSKDTNGCPDAVVVDQHQNMLGDQNNLSDTVGITSDGGNNENGDALVLVAFHAPTNQHEVVEHTLEQPDPTMASVGQCDNDNENTPLSGNKENEAVDIAQSGNNENKVDFNVPEGSDGNASSEEHNEDMQNTELQISEESAQKISSYGSDMFYCEVLGGPVDARAFYTHSKPIRNAESL